MIEPIAAAIVVFVVSVIILIVFEGWLHRLTKNPDRNYRWGVYLFSFLLAAWAFATSLGR